jgi:polysaccharide biosynthesis transport protein
MGHLVMVYCDLRQLNNLGSDGFMKQIGFDGGSANGNEGEKWQDRPLDYQQFDLVEVFRLVWRRKGLVALGSLAGALLGIAASLIVAPRYLAEGNLVVRSDALVAPEMDRAFDSMAVNEAVVTTEEEVLTSEGLLKRVAEQVDIPPDMLPESLSQRVRSWIEQFNLVDHNTLDILIPHEEQSQRAILSRRTRFVADATTLVTSKGSSVILVRAVTRDPQLSAAIVNGIMQLYMYDRSSEESRTARVIEGALRERLRQTRQQIEQAEAELVKTLQQPGAIETSETPGLMQRMTLIGNKLIDAHAELARRQAEYDAATQMHDGKNGTIDANSETIGKLREQLALFKAALAKTQATRSDPDYARAQQAQIQMLQAQITTEVERVIAQRKSDLIAARATVASLEDQASREGENRQHLSSTMIGVTGKRDAVASLWRTSDALEAKLIDLAAHPANLNARILSLASAPLVASFPSKALFAASGFLLSCMTTIVVLLISMHMRSRRPTMAIQVARMMNVPLLGSVPQVVVS